jgi:hypothetical protein
MKLKWDLFLVVTFALTVATKSPFYKNSTHLLSALQIEWNSKKPGSTFAFRLKKNERGTLFLCSQGFCLQAKHRWQLFPTPMGYMGNVGLLLSTPSAWVTRPFFVEDTLFERNHALIQLRLPASVKESINKKEEQISLDRLKDSELYKISSPQPWSIRWRKPVLGQVTSAFGSERTPGGNQAPYSHTGVDLHAPYGTQVLACADGIVLDEGSDPIYGNVLTIDHGNGLLSRYMHLSKFNTAVGEKVKGGDFVALSGSTGRSEAPHLHWEIRLYGHPVDPIQTARLLERLAYLE